MGVTRPSSGPETATQASPVASCGAGCDVCRELQTAALMIAGATGVEGVDEQTIALRCQRPVSVFDSHMGSASACLVAAYDRIVDRHYAQWSEAFARSATWADGMRAALRHSLQDFSGNPPALRLVTVEVQRGAPALRRRRVETRRRFVALLAEHDRRREARGALPELQFELMLGAIHQGLCQEFRGGRLQELPRQEDRLLQLGSVFEPLLA